MSDHEVWCSECRQHLINDGAYNTLCPACMDDRRRAVAQRNEQTPTPEQTLRAATSTQQSECRDTGPMSEHWAAEARRVNTEVRFQVVRQHYDPNGVRIIDEVRFLDAGGNHE